MLAQVGIDGPTEALLPLERTRQRPDADFSADSNIVSMYALCAALLTTPLETVRFASRLERSGQSVEASNAVNAHLRHRTPVVRGQ